MSSHQIQYVGLFSSSTSCFITICWQNFVTLLLDIPDPPGLSALNWLRNRVDIQLVAFLTHGTSAAGMHQEHYLPEQSISNSILCLIIPISSEDKFSYFQNKAKLNEYNHKLNTTTFSLSSQKFQFWIAHLITCWTWPVRAMVSYSSPDFTNC